MPNYYSVDKLQIQTFKKFSRKDKEKIAETIDSKKDYMILSSTVEDYVYATTRALDVGDYFGKRDKSALWEHAVNKNSDYFDILEMEEIHPDMQLPRYLSFRKAGMYKNHESDKIENSIGLVFDSILLDKPYKDMHVTALFGIDKKKAGNIARDLEKYPTRVPVSMGCSITHSVCTACGKEVYHQSQMCDCLKFARGMRRQGKKVAEILKGVDFFELSVVAAPAAPKSYVIDAISEIVDGRLLKIAYESEDGLNQLHIIKVISDMIKQSQSLEEKKRLSIKFDSLIEKLRKL